LEGEITVLFQGIPCLCKEFRIGASTIILYQTEGRNILFDTGPYSVRAMLTAKLKNLGLLPKDIDTVVLSHLHWDTAMNTDMFANAQIIVHKNEIRYAEKPDPDDWATPPVLTRILKKMKLKEIAEEEEIAKGVRIVELPGHSPGSIGLLIGNTLLAGDAISSVRSAANRSVDPFCFNQEAAQKSLRKALEIADIIYPGHDRPFRKGSKLEVLGEVNLRMRFFFNPVGQDQEIVIKSEKPLTFVSWPEK
jgi:N-acyl homoserine lactone hydrolase